MIDAKSTAPDAALSARSAKGRKCDTRRRVITVLAAGTAGLAAIAGIAMLGGYRLNLTPSEPLGLWRIEPLNRPVAVGDLVFICPPRGAVSAFGIERGYFRAGLCPSGTAPLIKTVAARGGSLVTVGSDVMIDGVPLPHSRLRPVDGYGRALIPFAGGIVPPGFLFLHSPFAGSYDSRYFGPVPETGLLGLARPVIVFRP
jgi:conjugative transfer signal peptidase TraF